MARFTVRIELYGDPSSAEYELLHNYMSLHGFSRTIQNDNNKIIYALLTAEYSISLEADKNAVLQLAKAATSAVTNDYGVLVTESNGRTWYGLKEIM